MIAKDLQPFSIVGDVGFKYFTKTLCPLYALPSVTTLTRKFDDKYVDIVNGVKKILSNGYVSITMDGWTEKHTSTNYLGVTCHFLANECELDSITLKLHNITALQHSSVNLLNELNDICCIEWGIKGEKIVSITTDNASNMVKTTRLFGQDQTASVRCFAHKLNLIVGDAFELSPFIKPVITKVRHIVTWFRQTIAASERLKNLQKDAELQPLRLIQDVDVRWNSQFYMINRFLEIAHFVAVAITKYKAAPPMVTGDEIEMLTEIKDLLSPLEEATKFTSGEKSMSASEVIPAVQCCYKSIRRVSVSSDPAKKLKSILLLQMDRRFKEIENDDILAKCTALDPRFKTAYFTSERLNRNKLIGLFKNGMHQIEIDLSSKLNSKRIVYILHLNYSFQTRYFHLQLIWDQVQVTSQTRAMKLLSSQQIDRRKIIFTL